MSDRYDPDDLFDQPEGEEDYQPPVPRLPQDIFKDPFEDDVDPSGRKEVFLPSFLGADEDDLVPPSLAAPTTESVGVLPMRERLARAVQRLGESESERQASGFAGADVSPPSLLDRLRARRQPTPTSAPPVGQAGPAVALSLDDPFARLLTPLGGPQLERLKHEVASDEVLFLRYEKSRQANMQRQGIGLIFAVVMLSLFFAAAGQDFLSRDLIDARAPDWLIERLGEGNAGAALFIIGLLVPFLAIGAIADTFIYTLSAITERSLLDFLIGVLSACFAAAILLLLMEALPLEAAATLVAWFIFRLLIGFLRR